MRTLQLSEANAPSPARPRSGKRLGFVLAAILLGLLPLIASEAILRCGHIGFVSDSDDPFVGFVNVRPLFRRNDETGCYEIAPERQTFFRPDSFSIQKRPDEFRIFCLGGSTVQGRPYAIETSFTTWLELNLQVADSRHTWQVVNCGGVSYASYRLVPIMQELLQYEPDMFILCTGHNEFLEDRTYETIKRTPRWIARSHAWLSRLHTYNAMRSVTLRLRGQSQTVAARRQPRLPEEVDALLDYQGGLDDYHRDASWRQGTVAHFDFNLRRMATIAHQHGIPLIVINPPYNLKDTVPFKYAHRADITDDERVRFENLWQSANREGISVDERIALLLQALEIDQQHAGIRFHLGQCYKNQREYAAAKEQFIAAKDEDICPLRILSEMRQIVADVADDFDLPLVDAQAMFEQLTPDGLTGNEWFLDHVHPSMRGHQRLAIALFHCLVDHEWVEPVADWKERCDEAFLTHLQSLDAMYYIRGQQRLDGLRRWAAGRASLIKPGRTPVVEDPQ